MNNHRVIALFLSCSWLSPPEYYGIGIQRKLSDRAIAPLHPGFIEKLLRDGGALHSSRLAFTVRIFFTVRISRPTNCVGAGGVSRPAFSLMWLDWFHLHFASQLPDSQLWPLPLSPSSIWWSARPRGGTGRIPWGCGESYEGEESESELWELRCFSGTTQKVQH